MSDLDADLYGDLYETDFLEELPAAESKTESTATSSKPTPIDTTGPKKSFAGTTSVQTPIAPPTQQIPTYEEPHTTEYRDQALEGGYQSLGSVDRSIRPSEMKDEGKMFIGGLNWETTDEGLRDYFSQFGKVDACTVMRDPTGRSRCFAFLTFDDPVSVNKVMVQEHVLDGKIIDPKRAIPRQEHQRATKLFIGGLAATVTSESMREFFSQFGKVIDSTVMMDRETGRSKGFGFVSLEDVNVQPFLGFGHLEIDGKLIDVKLAEPRYRRDGFAEDGTSSGGGYTSAGGFGNQQAATFSAGGGGMPAAGAGNTPFDPQVLANLYTRMFQMAGGGMGMSGMNPMMNMMGRGMGGTMNPMMGMGRGGAQGMVNQNIPRGPRAAGGPPTGPMGATGVGPQRGPARSNHHYHPYSR